jgi:hypothetical protein
MANPHLYFTVQFKDRTLGDLRRELILRNVPDNATEDDRNKRRILDTLWRLINGIVGATWRSRAYIQLADAAATMNNTLDRTTAANGDTLVIAGKTLTVAAVPANENQFGPIPATNALYTAMTVAAINANSVLQKIVRADVVNATTFSVTSIFPGPIGNLILQAETGNGFTLGGAALVNGAADPMHSFNFNYPAA